MAVFFKSYCDNLACRTWYSIDLPFDWPRNSLGIASKFGLIEVLAENWFDFAQQTRTAAPLRSRSWIKDIARVVRVVRLANRAMSWLEKSHPPVSAWVWHDFESCRKPYTSECVASTQLLSRAEEALETLVVCQNQSLTSITELGKGS